MKDTEEQLRDEIHILKAKLEHKNNQLLSIQYIGEKLSSELRTDNLLEIIMSELNNLMNAERSTFYIVDEERGELWSKIAQKTKLKEIRLKIGAGIAGHVAETGEIVNLKDAYEDQRFDKTIDKLTGYKTSSILCLPILEPKKNTDDKRRKIIGVLQVLNKKDGFFNDNDEKLLKSLSSQIAIAIINANLYSQLEKKINLINFLYQIEKELNQTDNLSSLLEKLVELICKALDAEYSIITLFKQDNSRNYEIICNSREIIRDTFTEKDLPASIYEKIVQDGDIVCNNNLRADYFSNSLDDDVCLNKLLAAPLKTEDKVTGILEVYNKKDINSIFRQEDVKLIQSLAGQISRSIVTFNLRDEKAKEDRLSAIGKMMSTIVHDLRTPMTGIIGFTDLMKEEEEFSVREEYSKIVFNQVEVLNKMANDILDFAKGKTNILPVKTAADTLIKRFGEFYSQEIINKGYKYQESCDSYANVYVDSDKIIRAFMNIMKNSLEAMDKGGTFSIHSEDKDDSVIFTLGDTGSGIPDEIKDNIFDSFVTSGKENGTGLGLAIVKKIIDQHQGTIEVESTPGEGTAFKIILKKL